MRSSLPDAAILDLQVTDGETYPVARELIRRGVPFVFATGHSCEEVHPEFQFAPLTTKPFDFQNFHGLLRGILSAALPVKHPTSQLSAISRSIMPAGACQSRCQ